MQVRIMYHVANSVHIFESLDQIILMLTQTSVSVL